MPGVSPLPELALLKPSGSVNVVGEMGMAAKRDTKVWVRIRSLCHKLIKIAQNNVNNIIVASFINGNHYSLTVSAENI